MAFCTCGAGLLSLSLPRRWIKVRRRGPFSPVQSAFPRQVLPAARSRAPRGTRHRAPGANAFEPASGASPSLLSLGRGWARRDIRSSSPRGRAGQALPVDFCNHHGSRTQPRIDAHPACRPGGYPSWRWICGQPCASPRRTGRDVTDSGTDGDREGPASASPGDDSPGSFAPTRSARTPRVTDLRPGLLEQQAHGRRNGVPANPSADDAPAPLRGRAAPPVPPRRGPCAAHPGCLPSTGGPRAGPVVHRLFPACGIPKAMPLVLPQ